MTTLLTGIGLILAAFVFAGILHHALCGCCNCKRCGQRMDVIDGDECQDCQALTTYEK